MPDISDQPNWFWLAWKRLYNYYTTMVTILCIVLQQRHSVVSARHTDFNGSSMAPSTPLVDLNLPSDTLPVRNLPLLLLHTKNSSKEDSQCRDLFYKTTWQLILEHSLILGYLNQNKNILTYWLKSLKSKRWLWGQIIFVDHPGVKMNNAGRFHVWIK